MADAPIPPLWFRFDGEHLIPLRPTMTDRHLVVGESYCFVEHHERSANSHRHFFACLNEAWRNLPDELLDEYPTAEHLRKKALVRKGYADERSIVCGSKAEAQRIAAFMKPMDDFAVVTVRDAVVRVYTAKSQSVKAMGAKEFAASKSDVLDFVADLIGVTTDQLAKAQAA